MTSTINARWDNFKKISWGEVIAIVTIILTVGGFALSRIDRQFDRIEKYMENIIAESNRHFERIDQRLDTMERDNRDFHGRLSHLEGKYENKEESK